MIATPDRIGLENPQKALKEPRNAPKPLKNSQRPSLACPGCSISLVCVTRTVRAAFFPEIEPLLGKYEGLESELVCLDGSVENTQESR